MTEASQANTSEIKETRKDFKDFSAKTEDEIRALWRAIERLAYEDRSLKDETQHRQKMEALEHEKLLLKVENLLLKSGHQLPRSPDGNDADK